MKTTYALGVILLLTTLAACGGSLNDHRMEQAPEDENGSEALSSEATDPTTVGFEFEAVEERDHESDYGLANKTRKKFIKRTIRIARNFVRLTNSFLGSGKCLDTYSDTYGGFMEDCSKNTTGTFWKIVQDSSGYVRLNNSFLGPTKCLDTYSDTYGAFMEDCNKNTTGTFWKIVVDGSGYVRLKNSFLGDSMCLDTYSDTYGALMEECSKNTSGTFWKFEAASLDRARCIVTQQCINVISVEHVRGAFHRAGPNKPLMRSCP